MENLTHFGLQTVGFYQNPSLFYSHAPLIITNTFLPQNLLVPSAQNLETSFVQLQQKYNQLLRQNAELKNQIEEAVKNQQNRQKKRKFIRRRQDELEKKYSCCYDNCKKQYASVLALNLHIKSKHRGGTKKQRDDLSKQIILAELNGKPIPKITFALPEGYVQKYRKQHYACPSFYGQHKNQNH